LGGGEGIICAIDGDESRVFKLFHKPTANHLLKLEAMLSAPPEDPQRSLRNHVSICWPEDIVFTPDGGLAGFVMPRLDTAKQRAVALYWNPEDRASVAPRFTWKCLCEAAANLARVVDLIHEKSHVIGDLNDENVLVNDRALVALVDCDSMQVRDPATGRILRCVGGRESYVSPESLGRTFADFDRSAADDRWALAVLVFQMLMEGQHPTSGVGDPEEQAQRIEEGLFPFLGEPGFSPPEYAVDLTLLPLTTRRLFVRCFRDGHADPAARPTALEWQTHLQQLAGTLRQCTTSPLHWYPPHHDRCPWCAQREAIGRDRFGHTQTARVGAQTALPSSSATASSGRRSSTSSQRGPHRNATLFGALLVLAAFVLGAFAYQITRARAEEQQAIAVEMARRETLEREQRQRDQESRIAERRRAPVAGSKAQFGAAAGHRQFLAADERAASAGADPSSKSTASSTGPPALARARRTDAS
jgi:DNA-binding helix-hairpin-helix protein with protein kinase domain